MNKCIVCNQPTEVIKQRSFQIEYHYCENCEFLYKDPKFYISSDEEKAIYDSHENHVDDQNYIAYFQRFIDYSLLPFIGKEAKGLDYGSGPEPVLATHLRRSYGLDITLYDLFYHDVAIPKGATYDFITCTEVIEHIENPLEILQFFADHLKPGGVLALMTTFHKKDHEFFQNWHYMRDMSHISFFREKTLRYLAPKACLEVIKCDGKRYTSFRKI